MNQNNYNPNWKKILGFRNMQEKLENVSTRDFMVLYFLSIYNNLQAYLQYAFVDFRAQKSKSSLLGQMISITIHFTRMNLACVIVFAAFCFQYSNQKFWEWQNLPNT